jgi:hypothetical protein
VLIHTNMKLSGSVAQYGRGSGMIHSVASQIIGQFGDALRAQLAQSASAATDGDATLPPPASPPSPSVKPISGFALLLRALKDMVARWLAPRSRP